MTATHRPSWCVRAAIVIVIVLGWSGLAVAQGQDASIIGQVTDESGAVLPGVTVTTSSPALQRGTLTTVTDERGEYRLTPLPIGIYEVAYELPGFQTLRQEAIRLTVGFSAKIDVKLKVGGIEESVTVSGASPVVDVSSTATSTQLTRETLELIGGRIIRDKLWFYVAERSRLSENNVAGVFLPDGSVAIHSQAQRFHTGKTSYQVTPGNRVVGFYTYAKKTEEAQDIDVFNLWEHCRNGYIPTSTYKAEWQGVKGNVVATAQIGRWGYEADYESF